MASLGIMIYLVARKVPQIIDVVDENSHRNQKLFKRIEKYISSLPLEEVDFVLSQWLEITLRKFKLYVMKLDNQLTHHLKKFKDKNSANGDKKLQLFENLESQETNSSEDEIDVSENKKSIL